MCPCTNVLLRVVGLNLSEELLNLAKALALAQGVRLYASIREGQISASSNAEAIEVRNWLLAASAYVEAKKQGYRVQVALKDGKVVVAGVTQ